MGSAIGDARNHRTVGSNIPLAYTLNSEAVEKKKKESRKETGYRLCYIFDSALQSKYLIVFFLFLLYMVFIFLFFIENFQVPTVSQFEQTESSWPTATSFSYGLLYSVGPLSFLLLQNSLKFTTVCMASISFTFHSAKDHVTEPV